MAGFPGLRQPHWEPGTERTYQPVLRTCGHVNGVTATPSLDIKGPCGEGGSSTIPLSTPVSSLGGRGAARAQLSFPKSSRFLPFCVPDVEFQC